MVGIAGTIALGIMALAACGLVTMLAIAAPVALANFFHARAHSKKKESLNIGGAMVAIGATIIIVYVGIRLFRILIPTVAELMNISPLLGLVAAVIMSAVMTGPMIPLFTYKLDRHIDDLSSRISEADQRLDFEESHRLLESLKTAEVQYEKRKNTTVNVLMIVFILGFTILYIFS